MYRHHFVRKMKFISKNNMNVIDKILMFFTYTITWLLVHKVLNLKGGYCFVTGTMIIEKGVKINNGCHNDNCVVKC